MQTIKCILRYQDVRIKFYINFSKYVFEAYCRSDFAEDKSPGKAPQPMLLFIAVDQ